MNTPDTPDAFGQLVEPTTLEIQRLLPGPIDRVWAYLTESELRRQWLAAGDMEMTVGSSFMLTWRNDELTHPPGRRPDGFPEEHSMQSRILELDPPHALSFTWGEHGSVSFTLAPAGEKVLLTITHRHLADRNTQLMVGPGWHAHLDVLAARLAETPPPEPFWDGWVRLQGEYARRLR